LWWPSLTKGMQTQQLLCWSGMTDTEHNKFGSNEEAIKVLTISLIFLIKVKLFSGDFLQRCKE